MSEKGGKGKQEQVVGGREEERKREEEGEGERFLANYCFKESIDSHQGGGFKLLILVFAFLGYNTSNSTDAQKKPGSDNRKIDDCVEGCLGMGSKTAGINPSQNK